MISPDLVFLISKKYSKELPEITGIQAKRHHGTLPKFLVPPELRNHRIEKRR